MAYCAAAVAAAAVVSPMNPVNSINFRQCLEDETLLYYYYTDIHVHCHKGSGMRNSHFTAVEH